MLQHLEKLRKFQKNFPHVDTIKTNSEIILRPTQYLIREVELTEFYEFEESELDSLVLECIPINTDLMRYVALIENATPKYLLLKVNLILFAKYNKLKVILLEPTLLKEICNSQYSLIRDYHIKKIDLFKREQNKRQIRVNEFQEHLEGCKLIFSENNTKLDDYAIKLQDYKDQLKLAKSKLLKNIQKLQGYHSLFKQRQLQSGDIIDLQYAPIYYDILVKLGKNVKRDQMFNVSLIPDLVRQHKEELYKKEITDNQQKINVLKLLHSKFGVKESLFGLTIPKYPKCLNINNMELQNEEEQLNELAIQLKAAENTIKSKLT